MSLKFKNFVTVTFEEVMVKLVKHEWKQESQRLQFKKFRNSILKEKELFGERYAELQKEIKDKIDLLDKEKDSEQIEILNKEFISKVNELCECNSELKPLDYSVVKECVLSQLDWDVLENVLENIPE